MPISEILVFAGRILRRVGNELVKRNSVSGIWIDVGAHHGETTLDYALNNPGLTIYAFEPNLGAAVSLIGRSANYIVVPMAIAEADGHAEFHINAFDAASSLLQIDERARRLWMGGEALRSEATVTVPTIRLDTFMQVMGITRVDFLKIDTQGADLAVLRSAGSRLSDVTKITLEVDLSEPRLYQGSASKREVVAFLSAAGFRLMSAETQANGQEENLTFLRSLPKEL